MNGDRYKKLLESAPFGYAYHKLVTNEEGIPVDYIFLEVNRSFEKFTGLQADDILQQPVTKVIPGLQKDDFDWIAFYGEVALNGTDREFEKYFPPLDRWYRIHASSLEKGYFSTVFVDITLEKKQTIELERFFSINLDLLCIADMEGHFKRVNKAWSEILGYAPGELENKLFLDFVHPDDIDSTLAAMSQLENQEKVIGFVNRYRSKDGTYRFIEWRSQPHDNLVYAAARDITNHKEALESLARSEEKYRFLTEFTSDVIWVINLTLGKFTYVSPTIYQLRGITQEEALAESLDDALTPESRIVVQETINTNMADFMKNPHFVNYYITEVQQPRKDGSLIWVEVSTKFRFNADNEIEVVGVSRNIEERKKMEAEIAYQSSFQRLIAGLSSDLIMVTAGNINEKINRALESCGNFFETDRSYLFQYSNDGTLFNNTHEWCRVGIPTVIHELHDVPFSMYPWWEKQVKQTSPVYIPDVNELPREAENEKKLFIQQEIKSLFCFPIMENDTVKGFIGFDSVRVKRNWDDEQMGYFKIVAHILSDVLNKYKIEQNLIEAKQLAEEASKAKSEFLANMSHEIRTPLNAVIGFTELLVNTQLKPEQKQYAENVNTAAHSLLGIINDILDLSKIEAGRLELEEIKTDIIELVEQTTEMVKHHAARKGLELLLNLSGETPRYAMLDAYRLKQILTNLLSNAVKFTSSGEVELKLEFTPDPVNPALGYFLFSVRDTGIGITPAQEERIFKAFSQADSSTTRKFGGTGLGLSISKKLLDKMGSELKLTSVPGKGSKFWFTLHVEHELGEPVLPLVNLIPPATITGNDKIVILIAEDVPINMELIKIMIKRIIPDALLQESHDGHEAVEMYKQQTPDLVLMDVQMPVKDGYMATKEIREREKSTGIHVPIIALTAGALTGERERCIEAGMDEYLAKPIDKNRLETFLRQFIKKLQ